MSTAHRGPLRYSSLGFPLDGAPLELVDRLSLVQGRNRGFQGYANDFVRWEGPRTAGTSQGWILSKVDGGTDAGELVAVRDSAQFGILRMLTNDADNDNLNLQLAGSPFRYVPGKRLWCAARLAPQDADDGELFFGLALEGDTNVFSTLPTDGIFLEKAETETKFGLHARKNGTSTENANVGSALADATMTEVAIVVEANGSVGFWQDGVLQSSIAAGNANLPDDEDLALYIAVQTGAAATRYLDVDWVLVAQER